MAAGLAIYTRKMATHYKGAPMQIQAIVMMVMFVFALLFLAVTRDPLYLQLARDYWWLFILSGFSFVASFGLTHLAYEYVDVAIGTLFSTLNIAAVVLVASLVIGEELTLHQYLGAGVLLLAIWVMLSTHVSKRIHGRWFHALGLSFLAALVFGVGVTTEKYLLDRTGLSTYLLFGWGSELLWALLFALLINRRKLKLLTLHTFVRDGMISGIFRTGTGFLFILALVHSDNSSLVAVWSGLRVLIAALLGIILLKERHFIKRKLEAGVLACIAIGILLW